MNGLSAALGISQLKKLKKKIFRREKIYRRYLFNFKNHQNIKLLLYEKKSVTNYWMNILFFENLNFKQINEMSLKLSKKKIETRRLWRQLIYKIILKISEI